MKTMGTKDYHVCVRIFARGMEMILRNRISSAHCTTGGERETVMPVKVVVLVAVVKMQLRIGRYTVAGIRHRQAWMN